MWKDANPVSLTSIHEWEMMRKLNIVMSSWVRHAENVLFRVPRSPFYLLFLLNF